MATTAAAAAAVLGARPEVVDMALLCLYVQSNASIISHKMPVLWRPLPPTDTRQPTIRIQSGSCSCGESQSPPCATVTAVDFEQPG
jgi:hypothetical protein